MGSHSHSHHGSQVCLEIILPPLMVIFKTLILSNFTYWGCVYMHYKFKYIMFPFLLPLRERESNCFIMIPLPASWCYGGERMKSWLWTWSIYEEGMRNGETEREHHSNPDQKYFWPEMAADDIDDDIPSSCITFQRDAYTLPTADILLRLIYAYLFSKHVQLLADKSCEG